MNVVRLVTKISIVRVMDRADTSRLGATFVFSSS